MTCRTTCAASLMVALVACDSNKTATTESTSSQAPTATTTATAGPAPSASASPSDAAKEGSFGALVGGADRVTIRITRLDGKMAAGDKPVSMDGAWVKKLVDAVGADTKASDAVPRCVPTYAFVFFAKGSELARFDGICDLGGPFVLVRDGKAFTAADSDAANALVAEAKPK